MPKCSACSAGAAVALPAVAGIAQTSAGGGPGSAAHVSCILRRKCLPPRRLAPMSLTVGATSASSGRESRLALSRPPSDRILEAPQRHEQIARAWLRYFARSTPERWPSKPPNFCRIQVEVGRAGAETGQRRANAPRIGQNWPRIGQFGPTFLRQCLGSGQTCPGIGQNWPRTDQIGPTAVLWKATGVPQWDASATATR